VKEDQVQPSWTQVYIQQVAVSLVLQFVYCRQWILKRWVWRMWTGSIWLGIGPSCGILWTW